MLIPKLHEIRKPTKTISGITPVAVMLSPRKCNHGSCLYCPNLNVPQSYTPKSPVVMRARDVDYDAFKQVRARIEAFEVMNHPTDKIELIIMGGTFLEYPKKFQYEFIKNCYDGLNGKKSKNLLEAQKLNENAKHRCVALCIETRPDVCVKFIDRMREFGATRVELGVQIIDDKIYKKIKRGHTIKDVADATKLLKNAGFKVGYHIMPGLPGSNLKKDLQLFKKLFSDERFKPDQIKIYPCQVISGSELENWYWKGKYKPYTKEETEKLLIDMLKVVPRYCRVMRVMREIPPEYLVAGTTRIDLRKDVEEELRKKKIKLKEIRYREIGFNQRNLKEDLKLKITKYRVSDGDEFFLEIVNSDDILFGLLRLRIFEEFLKPTTSPTTAPDYSLVNSRRLIKKSANEETNFQMTAKIMSERSESILSELEQFHESASKLRRVELGDRRRAISCVASKNSEVESRAIIRELHVYGKSLEIGKRGNVGQHTGLGKWLMNEAEKICRREKCKKISVISGVGVREYYRKLGYKLEETYMIKKL